MSYSCPCPVLAFLCLCPYRACLCFVCPCLCTMHPCPFGSSLPGSDGPFCLRFVLRDLYTHNMFCLSQDTIRSQSRTVPLYVFLETIWKQSFKTSSRWHPSTQAISFASATESPSRSFVLFFFTDSTFRAVSANSRSHGHLFPT